MPVLPAASVALTWTECRPSGQLGSSQPHVPSMVHSTFAPGSVEYSNAGVASLLGSGRHDVERHDRSTGVDGPAVLAVPTFPAASVALTSTVCGPSASSGASQLSVPSIVHST